MTISTRLFLIITVSLVAFSSTYKTKSKTPLTKQYIHSQTELTSHPHARCQKFLSKKKTEKEGEKDVNHIRNEPEFLWSPPHNNNLPHSNLPQNKLPHKNLPHNKLGGDKNPIQVAAQSKEFATYLYFPGERGIGDEDSEEGTGDKELVGIGSMEEDLAKVEERTKAFGKDLDKVGFQKRIWAAWGLKKFGTKQIFDSKSAKTAIISFAKALNKVETDVTAIEEEEKEEKIKQHWMKKYHRRLG